MTLQKQVVVISGASAGVGRATAIEFARKGAAVALLARSEDGLAGAVRDVEAAGGTALAIPVDVADAAAVEAAAEHIEQSLGPINVWVNSAMVTVFSAFHEMPAEEFQRVTQVTYLGTVNGTRAALARMRPRNAGCIIQVGSALAYRGIPLQSAYCGAKFAIRGLTDALRAELIYDKSAVHITMVQLAAFNTPQFDWARHRLPAQPQPLPPVFQPEIAARAIVWSAAHRRRELWVGFSSWKTILATQLFPGLSDKIAAKQAVSGQMDKPASSSAPLPAPTLAARDDNLFTPLPGDHGAHGRFDDEAKSTSPALWFSLHRRLVWSIIIVCVLAAIALLVGTEIWDEL